MQVEHLEDQHLLQLQERIQILEKEQVELVNIPVTEFDNVDPANIVNDFQRVSVCWTECSSLRTTIKPRLGHVSSEGHVSSQGRSCTVCVHIDR